VARENFTMKERRRPVKTIEALATGPSAVAALGLGALAIGAVAIGAVAVGRLVVGRARFGKVEIDHLVVRRLEILE
jgi:hypothetical protein